MSKVGYFSRKRDRRTTQTQTSSENRKISVTEFIMGQFGWVQLRKYYIPYIFRTGEKYCAVRMVEMELLYKYLNYFNQDIYSCICIRSYYITEDESKLLNEINIEHCDKQFGEELFTTKDLIVRLNDAKEFYYFLDVCYSKLNQGSSNPEDRCGFIRINKESVVPYAMKNEHKYVPLFYFEGETENLKGKADQLEGWDLPYLKFCCKVQGIRNKLYSHYSCAVISLNAIKSYFPSGTGFEHYWPSKVESQLLLNENASALEQWTRQQTTAPETVAGAQKGQVPSDKSGPGIGTEATGAGPKAGGSSLQQGDVQLQISPAAQATGSGCSGPGQSRRVQYPRRARNQKPTTNTSTNTSTTRQMRPRKRWRYFDN